jgi:excisionase family DNA binding protein
VKHRERDIPNEAEARELRELAALASQLHNDRKQALMDTLSERSTLETDPDLQLFTLAQLGDAYSLSTRTLQRYIERGDLEALKVGRGYRVTRAQIAAWIERLRVSSK